MLKTSSSDGGFAASDRRTDAENTRANEWERGGTKILYPVERCERAAVAKM